MCCLNHIFHMKHVIFSVEISALISNDHISSLRDDSDYLPIQKELKIQSKISSEI
jgi:hypothetical protein